VREPSTGFESITMRETKKKRVRTTLAVNMRKIKCA
jgi:hypothetical protein